MRIYRLSVAALAVTTILAGTRTIPGQHVVTVAAVSDNPVTTTVPATIAPTSTVDPAAVAAFLVAWDSATTTVPPTTQPAPTTTVRRAPPTTARPPTAQTPQPEPTGGLPAVLLCIRHRESRDNYQAYNPSGAAGAFQFMPVTARNTANHAGRPDLAGRSVLSWSPADQDAMALHLYHWQGLAPWGGGC